MKFTVGQTRALQSLRPKREEDPLFSETTSRSRTKKAKAGIGAVDYLPISLPTGTQPLPWTSPAVLSLASTPILQLHQEILDFVAFVSPAPDLLSAQKALVSELIEVLQNLYPGLSLCSYGSTETGLSLPSSDLDLRVTLPNSVPESVDLHRIYDCLCEHGYFCVFIQAAKVPIVRIEREKAPKRVEISLTNTESPWIYQEIARKPEIRPLIILLKAYLRQRSLNDTYTGGVGSYLLYHMVAFAVGTHPSYGEDEINYEKYSLGHYLLHFLKLYGEDLDFSDVALCPATRCTVRRSQADSGSSAPLLLLSPEVSSVNLASEGLRLEKVRKALRGTYSLLCEQRYIALRTTPLICLISPKEEI